MIVWIQLQSSVISAAAYDGHSLYIRFLSNHEYQYYKVPQAVFERLIEAPSVGQYFNRYIKNQYRFRKLS